MSWYGYERWKPYVPVAKRRAKAASYAQKLAKKEGRALAPVKPEGRKIAGSFWGQAWCDNLEHYSDFANRLPRGRTYVRNGSVIDLQIERGKVKAIVSGSEIYNVTVSIRTLASPAWKRIKQACAQAIDSLIDLLQGRFDQGIMQRLSQCDGGLFPQPEEIEMKCSCPDDATLCKHVAAVLYGVGTRLDAAPELLFTLRDVDHLELITQAVAADNLDRTLGAGPEPALAGSDLGEIFGIDIAAGETLPGGDSHADGKAASEGSARNDAADGRSRKNRARRRSPAASQSPAETTPTPKPRRKPAVMSSEPSLPPSERKRRTVIKESAVRRTITKTTTAAAIRRKPARAAKQRAH